MAKPATKNASTPNFGALLSARPSETERPKPMPVGSYICMVQGQPRFDKSAKKQTEFVEFTLKFLKALDDVDADDLKAYGGLADKTIKDTYYITDPSLWRLKDFLINCGLDVDEYEDYNAAIDDTQSQQIGVFIKHEPSQDGTSVFARVGKTFLPE